MILFTTIENFSDRFKIERLYMCYRNLMYKEALEIVQNPHSAEDAVSESFVRIIKNLHKIDEQDRPKTRSFLVIICRNVAKYAARAVGIADVYDALVNDRCYKKAIPGETALKMISCRDCGCFNPILIECLNDIKEKLTLDIYG